VRKFGESLTHPTPCAQVAKALVASLALSSEKFNYLLPLGALCKHEIIAAIAPAALCAGMRAARSHNKICNGGGCE